MRKHLPLLLFIFLMSCHQKDKNPAEKSAVEKTESVSVPGKSPEISKEETLQTMNNNLLQFLKNKNYQKLASYIHPEKGITFSMYAFVDPSSDKHFSKEDFLKYLPTQEKFTFGEKDGSGEKYITTIQNYLMNWVWQKDFSQSKYEWNGKISHGNTLENAKQVYPKADITVNFVPGTKEMSEMDWGSLAFVFEEFNGRYFLVAIINDRWTI